MNQSGQEERQPRSLSPRSHTQPSSLIQVVDETSSNKILQVDAEYTAFTTT